MSWLYLILAIILEVFATTMMKLSNGMTAIIPTIFMFVGYVCCFGCLSLSLKEIDVSVAYAIWSAVGIVLISIIGIFFFSEHISIPKIIFTALIIVGVVGLKLSTN